MSFIDENGSISDPYKNFIHVSRYSRWLEEKGRRETWVETVDRYMTFMKNHLVKNYNYKEDDIKFTEVKEAILNHRVMPSMRAMMTAGPALERENWCRIFSRTKICFSTSCSCRRTIPNKYNHYGRRF